MPDPAGALTTDQLVRLRAAEHGDTAMVIDPTARVTYRELDMTTKNLAATLLTSVVEAGSAIYPLDRAVVKASTASSVGSAYSRRVTR